MNEHLKIKEVLYTSCMDYVNNRLEIIQTTIKDIQVSLTSETKSSAGDKHETGRAMLQIEREKAGNKLSAIQRVKQTLSKIDIYKTAKTAGLGSLVYTSKANYFIGISAGEIVINNEHFYAISSLTPIAKLLLATKKGDSVQFRNNIFTITRIV